MQTIDSEEQSLIIKALLKRIEQLELTLVIERQQEQESVARGICDTIRYLRMHGTILLHIEDYDYDSLREEIGKNQESANNAAIQATREIWFLNKAPLAPDIVTALGEAANHGICRW